METIYRLDQLKPGIPSVVTVGVFDGVHLGHQEIMRNVKLAAREASVRSVVLTFDGAPEEIVHPERSPDHLTTLRQKTDLIARQDIDLTVLLPLSIQFLSMPADEFVVDILHNRLCIRRLVVGANFAFGKAREGNVSMASRLGKQYGFEVSAIPPVEDGGEPISSTRIRSLIRAAGIESANQLLGHRFAVEGTVVAGEGIGREIGYPTANILPAEKQISPPHGVYAVCVDLEGRKYAGVANLGTRPTVGGKESRLEVYIIGFSGNIYGRRLDIEFVKYLRGEMHFPHLDGLKNQIAQDVEQTLLLAGQDDCNRR